jgi:hypothetical protein
MRWGSRKPGKYEPLRSFGDAQFDRAGPRLPDPVTIAVALDQTLGILLAVGCSGLAFDFQFHQPLRGNPIISRNR